MESDPSESNSDPEIDRLPIQNYFIGWQCRVREKAMRSDEGRPNAGMRPRILLENGTEVSSAATLLLIPDQPQQSIKQFHYMALKTQDPKERYTKALQLLSAKFFQNVEGFSGVMSGVFSQISEVVEILEQHRGCVLEFNFQQQSFKIPFSVSASQKKEPVYEFTYWHNFLFNPHLPPEVKVLQFEPDWSGSSADPAPI